MSKRYIKYSLLSDKEIVDQILSGNEEAMMYLLFDRLAKDIRFFAYKIFGTLDFIDDLTTDLYLYLKGTNLDWELLKSFQFKSSLRTWMSSIISRFFIKKRKEMLATEVLESTIDTAITIYLDDQTQITRDSRLTIVLEAINQMKNEEQRLILIKELEGYNHTEIAQMIAEKRKCEGVRKTYKGHEVVIDARFVNIQKQHAVEQLKKILGVKN